MKSWTAKLYRFGAQPSAWLLLIAAVGMLLVLSVWHTTANTRSNEPSTHAQTQDWLRTAALLQQTQLAQAQLVLQVLSGISLPRTLDAKACNAFLARQLERFPQYINLAFTDAKGTVWCRAKALVATLPLPVMSAQEKPYLLSVMENQIGFSLPQFSPDGHWQGAVVAILPAPDFFPAPPVPNDAQATSRIFGLADTQGNLLITYPTLSNGAQKGIANHNAFWQASQAVSGSAEPLQLLLHLPTPNTNWTPYWTVMFGLLLSAAVLWRMQRRLGLGTLTRALRIKFNRLLPQATKQSPSNTQLLRGAYAELKGAFLQKEARVQQLVQLDELSQRLQSCGSTTEWADTVARCAQAIFPNCHGALYLRANAEHHGLTLAWGGRIPWQSLKPLDCHALHSDRPYVSHGAKESACAHASIAEHYACIPLQNSSGCLGLLYLAHLQTPNAQRTPPWAATAIAERATIGLTALRRQEQLHLRAIRDGLTGLFNRGFMEEALAIEQQQALRRDSCIGIMMLDVDHFKRYNDHFGHAAGDTLLRAIGKLIQQTVREGDMPCRYGGEEFVVILPGADLASTQQRAEALRLAIERWRPASENSALGKVTVSIGVAAFPAHGISWQRVLKCADEALYAAKHAGRNQVVATPENVGVAISA